MRTELKNAVKATVLISILFCLGIRLGAAIPANEREALIALYNTAGGDNWQNNSGWNGPAGSEGDWHGITVSNGHVTEIYLYGNNLSGQIPPELGNLIYLERLHLGGNSLSGNIPSQLGQLVQLKYLELFGNQLSGSIPLELENLKNLIKLDLGFNNLTGLLSGGLGNLSQLEHLSLSYNGLNSLFPSELGNLDKLITLNLSYNSLAGFIPKSLGNLSQLTKMFLTGNNLSGPIPWELGNLSQLTHLHLDENLLSGTIPLSLGNLTNLKGLKLSYNKLASAIPRELGNLGQLEYLYLSYNRLDSVIPSELGKLSNLERMILSGNQLRGPIPISFLDLNMRHIEIDYNSLYIENDDLDTYITVIDGGDWDNRQTIAPRNVKAVGATQFSIKISWTPINYSWGSGRYKIYWAQSSAGPYELWAETDSKEDSVCYVYGLRRGRKYYFRILTETDPGINPSTVVSEYSEMVSSFTGSPMPEVDPPFGSFDTPIDGLTATGSIPVTGWALDDTAIADVKIYRHSAQGLVFIGKAVMVEGARPDVAAAYPLYPANTQAGWGYMLLTNFLPNGGNGTVKLEAIAWDAYGKKTSLGSKTIYCDNANAIKPFGAIDTPLQGGVASGSAYVNFGWALTPQPNTIPTDGSTITVWVDGVALGHPVYNQYRADIAELFPGYTNSNGAVGYFYLDTTAYDNGVHTIQWTVNDDAGNTDGIGSRYFTIQNSQNRAQTKSHMQTLRDHGLMYGRVHFRNMPLSTGEPVRREIPELGRLKIQLTGNTDEIAPNKSPLVFQGFQMVGHRVLPLPAGSYLDKKQGIFYWQPGVAFLGDFHLVFVKTDHRGKQTRRDLFVTIHPGQ